MKSLIIHNYRSFLTDIEIKLNYKLHKPVTIFWWNDSWKSNFLKALLYGIWYKYGWDYSFKKEDYYFSDTSKNLWVSVYFWQPIEGFDSYHYTTFSADYLDWTPSVKQKLIWPAWEKWIWKNWRRELPIYVIDSENLKDQFRYRTSFWTLTPFWRYINSLKEDFNVGFEYYPEEVNWKDVKRLDFLKSLLSAITNSVIKSEEIETFLGAINSKLEDKELSFSMDYEAFFDKLELQLKDNEFKPEMPLSYFWNWFLFELLFLFFETTSKELESNVFIFNKPESFLDTKAQKTLYKKLESLSEKNQVLIISSSSHFVSIKEPSSIIKLINEEGNWTETKQTYFVPKKPSDIEKLENAFPEFKDALLLDKAIFVYNLDSYLKLKEESYKEQVFYIHSKSLVNDLSAIFSDFWVETYFVWSEIKREEIEEFIK